ncbi:hypothetical protein ACJRO7_016912 [Eucalyptus globulus]|uniref:Splicing factor YJU2 n=1 Tax=Eucalyptus globulus TaxID=34317 RepID=A0ABD3KNB7_EUCGL
MRERKVMKKYYQPDFVPSKLPRLRRSKNRQIKVWMMLPMSIRCNTCGSYITRAPSSITGRRTSSARSTYLGIRILMFYSKCTHCFAELTIKTDPRNSDYLMESGATRTFKPWRPQDEAVEGEKRKRETEEMHYRIKTFYILVVLTGGRYFFQSGRATVSTDAMLQGLQRTSAAKEEDEVLTKSIVFHTSKDFVCRIEDEDSEDEENLIQPSASDESLNTLKKRKLSEEFLDKPTDSLTKATSSDILNDRGIASFFNFSVSFHHVCSSSKSLSTSSSVRIAVVKKADRTSSRSIALQSLCEYESSDDEDLKYWIPFVFLM